MTKGGWAITFYNEVGEPGKPVSDEREEQDSPKLPGGHGDDSHNQSQRGAAGVQITRGWAAVLAQVEYKKVIVAGELVGLFHRVLTPRVKVNPW